MAATTMTTMTIPRDSAPAPSTRQRLIDAGYELFSRRGFHGVGLDVLLREVGLSKQTFYNHFESKEDLALAVLARRSEDEMRRFRDMTASIGGRDPLRRLDAVWDVLEEWFSSPGFRGCIFITAAAEFPGPHEPVHVAAAEHVRRTMAMLEELATAAGATEPRELAERLMILIDGAVIAKHVAGNGRAAELARDAARGIVARYVGVA